MDGIANSLQNLTSNVGNWFNSLLSSIGSFFNPIINVISYVFSIIQSLWYGLTSLLSGIWDLIVQVFTGGVFSNVGDAMTRLVDYLGAPAVIFIATLLLIVIFRIGISFVFKIFRMRLDYDKYSTKYGSKYH